MIIDVIRSSFDIFRLDVLFNNDEHFIIKKPWEGFVKPVNNNMSGDVKFEGTQEEWDALVRRSREKEALERVIIEEKELGEKIAKLNLVLNNDEFSQNVGWYQFNLLSLQHSCMVSYRRVLNMRIDHLKFKP